jgi:hypothetical protein
VFTASNKVNPPSTTKQTPSTHQANTKQTPSNTKQTPSKTHRSSVAQTSLDKPKDGAFTPGRGFSLADQSRVVCSHVFDSFSFCR